MITKLRHWFTLARRQRDAQWRHDRAITDANWNETLARIPWLAPLDATQHLALKQLATQFLCDKEITGAGDFMPTEHTRIAIAAQACVPILRLGLDWYAGFRNIILYPDEFVVPQEYMDDIGVVHAHRDIRTGEAWLGGPIVLAASEIFHDGRDDGVNIVIHEFAHKIDMQNGAPNGFPPLHKGMSRAQWTAAFSAAYEDFCQRVDAGEDTALDPYASEAPEEFFAVMCEAFFLTPGILRAEYPEVFRHLATFFCWEMP